MPNQESVPSKPRRRAKCSRRRLTPEEASLVKGTLLRGDRQSSIAAHFGAINQGRIAEISTGAKFANVPVAPPERLPPRYRENY